MRDAPSPNAGSRTNPSAPDRQRWPAAPARDWPNRFVWASESCRQSRPCKRRPPKTTGSWQFHKSRTTNVSLRILQKDFVRCELSNASREATRLLENYPLSTPSQAVDLWYTGRLTCGQPNLPVVAGAFYANDNSRAIGA